ncbi:MAG: BrnT family toxin [Lachnospiraceae bacterium]|nr:BrnT family toxin [Lachnospiraceae bacterium]
MQSQTPSDEYRVEWDDEKNIINVMRHGVSFETAALVFADENYIELYDEDHSQDEDRYIAIGIVDQILYVVHTIRGEAIRLISARPATKEEERLYYDSIN